MVAKGVKYGKYLDVGARDLVKLVAKSSGYHEWQVEDIMRHLGIVIRKSIHADKTVYLKFLGTFSARTRPAHQKVSNLNGEQVVVDIPEAKVPKFKFMENFMWKPDNE